MPCIETAFLLSGWMPRWLPWWLFAVLGATWIVVTWFLYSSDRRSLGRVRGLTLTTLRSLVLILVCTLLLDLYRVETRNQELRPILLCVLDDSKSMLLEDEYKSDDQAAEEARASGLPSVAGLSRWTLLMRSLEKHAPGLAKRFELHFATLGGEHWPRPGDDRDLGTWLKELDARSDSTDLSRLAALQASLEDRERLTAILLFSDGRHNTHDDPLASLSTIRVPVYSMGLGSKRHPTDISIAKIDAPNKVFVGDTVDLELSLDKRGLPAQVVHVVISEDDEALENFDIDLPAEDGTSSWSLSFDAGSPGRKRISIRSAPLPEEHSSANNEASIWLEVLGGESRCLYLDDRPRWEQRYARSAWLRDKHVELDAHLVTRLPDARLPEGFPRTREEIYAYDVLILGDVSAEVFSSDERQIIHDYVIARGGTLILLSGPRHLPSTWGSTILTDLLPLENDSFEATERRGFELAQNAKLDLTASGEASQFMRLIPGRESNLELWRLLPAPSWIHPARVTGDDIEVLVVARSGDAKRGDVGAPKRRGTGRRTGSTAHPEDGNAVPIIFHHAVGAGKVLYSGIDSVWKWRYRFGDRFVDRFWRQAIRWAISDKLSATNDIVSLGTDRIIYEEDATIRIDARLASGETSAWIDAVIASAEDGAAGKARLRLEALPRSGGRYRGTIAAKQVLETLGNPENLEGNRQPGTVECRISLATDFPPEKKKEAEKLNVRFAIASRPSKEEWSWTRDESQLEEIARRTGGEYVSWTALGDLIARLPHESTQRKSTETQALIDHPLWIAAALMGLLGVEWTLRKRWKLI